MNSKGYAILAIIANQLTDEEWSNLMVEPFLNGRESGFSVRFYNHQGCQDVKLLFCESRHSDNIVIYKGKPYQFHPCNAISDEIARNSFDCAGGEYEKAARMIISELRQESASDSLFIVGQ